MLTLIVHTDHDCHEAIELGRSLDFVIAKTYFIKNIPNIASTCIGKGHLEEICNLVKENNINIVFFDIDLTPAQQRNLSKILECDVIERTGVIIKIFSRRARTSEGRLQVQLAELEYQKTRLIRNWTHLERQRGNLGKTGGPGESQLELDKRMIQKKIIQIRAQLQEVKRTRALHREARQAEPYPIVALVGYTNAGKSSLFNVLTKAEVFVEDLLFATLDPTMRVIKLNSKQKIILSDTVGFISKLPVNLVDAFSATLEEVVHASLILHVTDLSSPYREKHQENVKKILHDLNVHSPIIDVYNKCDLVPETEIDQADVPYVRTSAKTGEGLERLVGLIQDLLTITWQEYERIFSPFEERLIASVYDHGIVLSRENKNDSTIIHFKMSKRQYNKIFGIHQ